MSLEDYKSITSGKGRSHFRTFFQTFLCYSYGCYFVTGVTLPSERFGVFLECLQGKVMFVPTDVVLSVSILGGEDPPRPFPTLPRLPTPL